MASKASSTFVERWTTEKLWDHDELFDPEMPETKLLGALKGFARKYLYSSSEAMNPEIAGYKIIRGILDSYKCVLQLSKDDFKKLAFTATENPSALREVGKDYEYRLIRKLPHKHLDAYKFQLEDQVADELSLRCHLIVDYIAGMTDHFALETYQLLHGIKIS
jgi:dGTPase